MKFKHLSRVYLSDDEYYELLSPKNIAQRNLLRLARARGLVFSERCKNEEIRSQLVLSPSNWETVSAVLGDMARPDPAERKTSRHVTNCLPSNETSKLIDYAKKERIRRDDESYSTKKISDDTVRVEVTYTDVNYSMAVPYQRRERKLYVDVTNTGSTISFRYTANERAKQIVELMQSQVKPEDNAVPAISAVSLYGVRDAVLRTKFFTDLIRDIEGFKYESATQVNVDSRFPETDDEDSDEETTEQTRRRAKVADTVKGLVNRMAFTGEQVLADQLYQQAAHTGYYICNIAWSCVSKKDSRFHIDCEAGFTDAIKADQFTFDVTRSWRYKPESPDEEESLKVADEEKRRLAGLVEAAAFRAYTAIMDAGEKTAKKPRKV